MNKVKPGLAKAYEAKKFEKEIYRIWEDSGFFNPDNLPSAKKPFVISMPPPNVTGVLHLGHASALTYEDIIIRYRRLLGFKTLWLPGTDHAAIATQARVEKKLAAEGLDRHRLGREKFLQRVRDFVADSRHTIKAQTKAMGSSCDWSRERYTLDHGLSRAVAEAFIKMYQDGLIYRGQRIVNWCPRCASTLADDEVEYREEKTPFYYFRYGPVVIGTARPETKFADKVIIVHPQDKRYKKLIGQELEVEWINGQVKAKILADKIVDINFGTGAMTITPAHSFEDFALAQKYKLPIEAIINKEAKLTQVAGPLAGLFVQEARKKVVEILKKKGLLERIDHDYIHNLSVCYRCDTAVEPLVSEQWFVAVDKKITGSAKTLKELAIQAVKSGEIKILPQRFEKIYFHWMNNLHDWCISRQIWWGHRIPVWYTADKNIIVAPNEAEAQKIASGQKLIQDPDTLDTWFSSALWTFSTLGWPASVKTSAGRPIKTGDLKNFHPTQVMETGYDILFFWVARMILMSEYVLGEKPFETVYLHGMIRDKEGRKMSKSLDNGIDPTDMIDKFGADALRLSMVIGATPGADLRLYEEKIAGYRNFVNKLWNISRFIFGTVADIKIIKNKPKTKTLADRWILAELDNLIGQVTKDLDNYRFSSAAETLYEFTWRKLADWYLEIAKIEKSKDEILSYILERLLILWHPFAPFVTEVLWQQFDTKDLLMMQKWPPVKRSTATRIIKGFTELQNLVIKIRNLKAANNIAPAHKPNCHLSSKVLSSADLSVVASLARVQLVGKLAKAKVFKTSHSQGQINLTKAMSDKEKQSLQNYIQSLEAKLANEKFLAAAPRAVIEQSRENLENARHKLL